MAIPLYFVLSRYHKVAWGGDSPGVIVGGCDNGVIQMFNVSKLLDNEDGLIANPERHTGAVKALDFNPFQVSTKCTLKIYILFHYNLQQRTVIFHNLKYLLFN